MLAFLTKIRRQRFAGTFLRGLGVLFGFIALVFIKAAFDFDQTKSIALFLVLAGAFGSLSLLSLRYGKKLSALAALAAATTDYTKSVIYLRSFSDDKETSRIIEDPLASQLPFLAKTEEEVLGRILSKIGPCFAIGPAASRKPSSIRKT